MKEKNMTITVMESYKLVEEYREHEEFTAMLCKGDILPQRKDKMIDSSGNCYKVKRRVFLAEKDLVRVYIELA
jgi:hypothetical protein